MTNASCFDNDLVFSMGNRRSASIVPQHVSGTLFNPSFFMYGEDMELCHQRKQAGHRVLYSPVAPIIHYQGASMRQQQGDVLLSSLKGPRQFYRQVRSAPGEIRRGRSFAQCFC
jgi:GT2 family glycosyltransferase